MAFLLIFRILLMQQNKILKDFKKLHHLYFDGEVFVAFDTETTTLSSKTGNIIEIGAVSFDKNGIISTWNSLFYPGYHIPQEVTDLTHITDEMVFNSPKIESKLQEFMQFIDNHILIAHNAMFDLKFLNKELINSKMKGSTNKVIDTLMYSRWAYPTLPKHKLSFLADYFNFDKGQSHRATDDALTCMQLFIKIVKSQNLQPSLF